MLHISEGHLFHLIQNKQTNKFVYYVLWREDDVTMQKTQLKEKCIFCKKGVTIQAIQSKEKCVFWKEDGVAI